MQIIGIDIGGSGIKAGIVDTEKGQILGDRIRIPTPQPSTPEAVAAAVAQAFQYLNYQGPAGIGFPAAITDGVVRTAANIDKSWIGVQAEQLFSQATGSPCSVINDADAAGLAEIRFGEGRDVAGTVIVITVGTGIGTSVFLNGNLLPNTELGHLMYKGRIAEKLVSDATRKKQGLSWKKWAKRFSGYLRHLEGLFYPELIIIGGGTSKKWEKFSPCLKVNSRVLCARHFNDAGIIGAAMAASRFAEQG